jgi:hypothetical protein
MRAQVVLNNDYVNAMPDADQRVMRKAVMQGTNQVLRNSR